MTPERAAAEFARVARELPEAVRGVVRQSAVELLSFAREQSSGPLQERDLARMDHPYARRHGRPRLNPNLINRRLGNFYAGWDLEGPFAVGGAFSASVFNTSDEAEYLADGTRFMFERHPEEAALEREQPLFEARAEREIARVLG
jgi:hypothetical protein